MISRKIQSVLAQMQKNLECSICLEMMKNPVSTACGHQFCRFCIMEFLERKRQVPCPLCKKPVTKRGLMQREQLGEMVLNVHKLIEAYQTDTGTLFSPPRGASVTCSLQPSTPESIKTKGTGRQSKTRQSDHIKSREKRASKETRVLQMDLTAKDRSFHQDKCSEENPSELSVHNSSHDMNGGDNSSKGSSRAEEVTGVLDPNVQELLDVTETGSHGASENQTVRETELEPRVIASNLQNRLNDHEVNHKIARNCPDDTAVKTNAENNKNEKQKDTNDKAIDEDLRQSLKSTSSQGSSEDVISLFRTPLDIKEVKQKQKKVHNDGVTNTRSLRSAKTVIDHYDKDTDMSKVDNVVQTPDFDYRANIVCDSKPSNIKTYSKKNVLKKDSKSKVSDWLKNLPDDNCEILQEKQSTTAGTSLESPKSSVQRISKSQNTDEMISQKMNTFAGRVHENCQDSLFGFGELDLKDKMQGETDDQNYQPDIAANEIHASVEVNIVNLEDQEQTQSEKEKNTCKPLQRKRIFKSKQVYANTDTKSKSKKDTDLKNDMINSKNTEDNMSKIMTDENVSKPETQYGLSGSAKSQNDRCESKPDKKKKLFKREPLESNISGTDEIDSFINECSDNSNNCEGVPISIRAGKSNCVNNKQLKDVEKPERLLKMVYSPMDTSQSFSDPYEFKSSQKTPQKQLKGKRSRSNKAKARNKKGRVVKVTDKLAPKKTQVSIMNGCADIERTVAQEKSLIIPETLMKGKRKIHGVNNGGEINKDIDRTEMQVIAAEIEKAEEYDLLTNTQEVLTKMTENEGHVTCHLNDSLNRVKRKQVRFREPTLSDFISPGKNDVRKPHKEKEIIHKEKEQSTSISHDDIKVDSCKHENNQIKEELCDEKDTGALSMKKRKKSSDLPKGRIDTELLPDKEDEDSDDLSEDYRFHDNSSGTDDLDINPDQDDFEQPDLEKQPEDVKALLSQNKECNDPKVTSTSSTPDLLDTPEVLRTPHLKSTSARILKESMVQPVGIVKETPLLVSSVADTPQVLNGPHFKSDLCRKTKGTQIQPARVSKNRNLDANVQPDSEYCNENPVVENRTGLKEKHAMVGCGNDKEMGTVEETPLIYAKKTEPNTELKAKQNSSSEIPININENYCKEPEIHCFKAMDTEAVNNVKKVTVQNFDVDSLEQKENGSIASIFSVETSNHNVDNKVVDDLSCEKYIATKVDPADIEITMDTDETQTPCNFDMGGAIEDEEVIICEETNMIEQKQFQSDDQEGHTSTTADSQASISVFEFKKTTDKANEAEKELKAAEFDSDIVVASTDSDRLKNVKKKRKCFMLEETQNEVEVELDNCFLENVTPKRQRTDSELDTNLHLAEDVEENGSSTQADQSGEGFGKTYVDTIEILNYDNKKKQMNDSDGIAEELAVNSQSSAKVENSFERERHLSGILISPNDTFHKSPEDIFSIDSGMPAVDFSPEEETQCEEDSLNVVSKSAITDTDKTHVSDTQMSVSQLPTHESCKPGRQHGKVRAARGFSKRAKNSLNGSTNFVKTTEPKDLELNKVSTSLGFGQSVSIGITNTDNIQQKDNKSAVSPASHHSLTTPGKANILKYKSPVAGIKPLGQSPSTSIKHSPQVSPSVSSFRNKSKYSQGLHRTPNSTGSPYHRDGLVGNTVEVVEVKRKDVKTVEVLGDAVKKEHSSRKVSTESETRNKHSSNNDKISDKEINHSFLTTTEPAGIDSEKDLKRYTHHPKENVSTKKSPKLRLNLGSQEKHKMVEEIPTDEHKQSVELPDIRDQQGESCKELGESKLLQYKKQCTNIDIEYINSDNRDNGGDLIAFENNYDHNSEVEKPDGNGGQKNEIEPEFYPLDNEIDNENDALASSPYLVIEDDVIKNLTTEKICEKQNNLPILSKNQADNSMYESLDLSLDDSDSSDDDLQGELFIQTRESSKFNDVMDEKEAEVIEESDLDVDESEGELEADQDEVRSVKRIRPKRAILSDSDDNTDDESLHLDCTSSSAFSSQSENLTTQERDKLERDLDKMAAEMALLKEQLKINKGRNDCKNDVVILDDHEDEMIQMDDSDQEIAEEPCLSPPPFSPDILSQEKSRDCVLLEDSTTDDKGPATKVPDNTCIENVPIRGGDSTENVLIREPLKDIDVNIVRERITQDLETDKSTLTKRRTGFIATGLSSFQVMEVKKMASVNDVQFYSKMNPSVSHVIVKSDENDPRMCDRTLKFFQGIARKCWLVNYQWILDSKEAGHLLPETAYEIQGDTNTGYIHEGPKKSRLSEGDLFKGIKFALFGDNKYLNKDSLIELIKDCGGETADLNQLEKFGENNYVICCIDLDEEGEKQKKRVITRSEELKSRCGVVTLKRDWIMDSVTTYKLQPIKLYTISSDQD